MQRRVGKNLVNRIGQITTNTPQSRHIFHLVTCKSWTWLHLDSKTFSWLALDMTVFIQKVGLCAVARLRPMRSYRLTVGSQADCIVSFVASDWAVYFPMAGWAFAIWRQSICPWDSYPPLMWPAIWCGQPRCWRTRLVQISRSNPNRFLWVVLELSAMLTDLSESMLRGLYKGRVFNPQETTALQAITQNLHNAVRMASELCC